MTKDATSANRLKLKLLLLCTAYILLAPRAAPVAAWAQGAQRAAADALFREGSDAFAGGDMKKAQADFARLVQLAPNVAVGHSAYGAVLLAEGDLRHAVLELTTARRLDPNQPEATINLAVARMRLGDYAEAVRLFREVPEGAVRLQPSEVLAYAVALRGIGDRDSAEAQLRKSLAIHASGPDAAQLWDALGSLEAQQDHYDTAAEMFQKSLAANHGYAPAHAHLGSVLLLEGKYPDAVAELRTASDLGDNSLAAQVDLGRALSLSGDDTHAVSLLRALSSAHPESLDAQYAFALALEASGQSAEALPLFAKVTDARPHDAAALTNYGLALVQSGDAKSALAIYARAASISAASPALLEDTGVAYLQTNDIEHAIEQFRAALDQDPRNAQLHYDLGLAYKLKDDLPQAIVELQRAQSLDPDLPDPAYTLGVIRMQQGNAAEAVHDLQRAVTLNPKNGEAWALLGAEEKDAGNLDAAIDALRHAIVLEPDQPSPHITLAAILSANGDREAAAAERRTAADLSRSAMKKQRAGFALQSGRALLKQGDIAGAVLQLQDAVAAEPELKEAHLLLADALQKQGRSADALAERQKAERIGAGVQ